jgi:hypothetical protein
MATQERTRCGLGSFELIERQIEIEIWKELAERRTIGHIHILEPREAIQGNEVSATSFPLTPPTLYFWLTGQSMGLENHDFLYSQVDPFGSTAP